MIRLDFIAKCAGFVAGTVSDSAPIVVSSIGSIASSFIPTTAGCVASGAINCSISISPGDHPAITLLVISAVIASKVIPHLYQEKKEET